jgi:hypothetical protein
MTTPTIIAMVTTAIKIMTGTRNGFFSVGLAGGGAGVKVATGVPHLWQNRAFSSSFVPHIRQ